MTDEAKKVVDSVLTCCTGANCVGCDFKAYRDDCTERMGKAAADLIERQDAEIKRLNSRIADMYKAIQHNCGNASVALERVRQEIINVLEKYSGKGES